jgi:SAM-dependent methyltransferase
MTLDLSRRSDLAELMDSDETDFATFRDCLVDLARVNTLTLAFRSTLQFFDRLAKTGRLPRDRAAIIVDVGSGFGDTLRVIDHWAKRRGIQVDLTGVDRNPWSTRAATEATGRDRAIRFVTADVFGFQPPRGVDIIISSLFAHHLDEDALARFVSWMETNAEVGWFVNDLHRHPLPFHLFRVFSRAMRIHRFVQHDGPVSIARAFDTADWRRTFAAAGIPAAAVKVQRVFPFRLCVSRVRGR